MRSLLRGVIVLYMMLAVILIFIVCGKNGEGPETVTNVPPGIPSNPNPQNGATDQSIDVNLSWTCVDQDENDTLTCEVYLGTQTEPPYQHDINGTTYEPGTLTPNTTYYWKIVAKDNHDNSTAGPIWQFTTSEVPNSSPNQPQNPDPANGQNGVSVTEVLRWDCTDPDIADQLTYNVYFGLASDSLELVSDHQQNESYTPELEVATTYYWRITAFDMHGEYTEGPIWNFTTIFPDNNPPNAPRMRTEAPDSASIEQSLTPRLSWYCSDSDGHPLVYDVYFGTTNPPALVVENLDDTRYSPGMLELATTYYWRIEAIDIYNARTSSSLWFFTTQTTNPPLMIWYGNIDGENINATIGERFDVDVYFQTTEDTYVANTAVCLGANQTYVDSLLSKNEGTLYYPFTEWDSANFNSIYDYETGWFCEPFVGFASLFGHGEWLHFGVPTKAITLKMKATDDADYAGQTVEAFAPGEDRFQGPTNAGDSLGDYSFNLREFFNLLHFNQ